MKIMATTAILMAVLWSIPSCRTVEMLNDDGSGEADSASDGDADTDSDADGDSDSGTEEVNYPPVTLYGVDILVVVDNSSSMAAEQEILSNALFSLIAALPDPTVGSDIHIAFTTSDMGLSWGGNAFDPLDDGWPGGSAPEGCEDPRGDEGRFITAYATPTVQIGNEELSCPELPDSMEQPFFSSSNISWQETDLALAAACTANVGIDGCGFEQQLTAATAALEGDGIDTGFMRPEALLLVLLVSDEEDCSMEDGPGLFEAEEVQDQYKRNIACGSNREFLYSAAEIKEMIINAKAAVSGASRAVHSVMFAAIVGVPDQGGAGAACQGSGADIAGCLDVALDEGTMGNPGIIERLPPNTTAGPTAYYFEYACERFDGDTPVTQAYPGTRFVQLAREFGHLSYVYSICNADWAPAMNDIARIITDNLSTDDEPFDTDSGLVDSDSSAQQ